MNILTSTRSILNLVYRTNLAATFAQSDPDRPSLRRVVEIDAGTWVDLGSPDVITVTVEAGDKLNG